MTRPETKGLIKIAPSILTADIGRIRDQVIEAQAAGVDYMHLDIMDGHFVPVITFGAIVVQAVRKAIDIPLDIHMMVEQPELYLQALRDAGGDILNVHVEATRHLHRTIEEIHRLGAKAGVSINPETPLSAIEDALGDLDQVMVMSVHPGWGGQSFIEGSVEKLAALKAMVDARGLSLDIEIDGGINLTTAPRCVAAGANILIAGSAIYNDRMSVAEAVRALRASVEG